MSYKLLASSLSTVHFKRPLFIPANSSIPHQYAKTNQNAPILTSRFHPTSSSMPEGRFRASLGASDPTQFDERHPTHYFISFFLKVSAKMRFLPEGKQLHGHVMKLGLYNVLSIENQILNVYVKCREFGDVQKLFDEMSVRNLVSWNTVICGVVYYASSYKTNLLLGFYYFRTMLLEKVAPDEITFNGLFRSCIELNDVASGRQLHGFVVKTGFDLNCFVGGSVVDLYAKSGLVHEARLAFDRVLYKDLVLLNVMLYCYVFNSLAGEALRVFNLMRLADVKVDDCTFTSLLSSCDNMGSSVLGKQLHGLVIRHSYDLDVLVASSLVNMYVKNEMLEDAHQMFDEMPSRNVVSWTTVIVGYGKQGYGEVAMRLLQRMFHEDHYPDELTLASVASSCGSISGISGLRQVHSLTEKSGFRSFLSISNALINAYSKCGRITSASQCFSLVVDPDLVTWTSIIYAYAFHGLANKAIDFFEKMLSCGVKPDGVAFLGVLSACCHGGIINMGLHYFKIMTNRYRIVPSFEIYTCLIDLIGRAGLIDEAFDILNLMAIEARPETFAAFIGACKVHGNVGLAKWGTKKLLELEPNKPVNYTLMSNMYAFEGCWVDVAITRKMMKESCEYKAPGCSWMEISGRVHTFVSNDRSHPQALELYAMLGLLIWLMKKENHISCLVSEFDNVLDDYVRPD